MNSQLPVPPQQVTQQVPTASLPPAAVVPIADKPQTTPVAPVAAVPQLPAKADDLDMIEPEWIHRVEQTIEKSATDPFTMTHELNALKADYLKKRYGRDVKAVD